MSIVAQLPETNTPRPTRMEEPFADLRRRLAERGFTGEEEPVELEAYVKHAEFERQRDAEGRTRYEDPTDCGGTLRVFDRTGPVWLLECDGCRFTAGLPMQRIDPNRMLADRLHRAGIPEQFAGKTFEKDNPQQQATLEACRMWTRQLRPAQLADSIPAVALYGRAGRGKTHLLSLMVESVIRLHKTDAVYRSAAQLLDELRAGLDERTHEALWQRVLRVPVLAIDDLGADRFTEWSADRLATLVDYRYGKALPLLIATNVPPAGWAEKFGERTASRLRGMCVRLELAGPDRREHAQQSFIDGGS